VAIIIPHNDEIDPGERPLVSFCIFAYNQEKYILEAISGALAQKYDPLEIIISDDCSTDNTFEIIENAITNYNGSHRIVLNRNVSNLGVANHVNKILEIANGELIVLAAGDDVSEDYRTIELVQYWLLHNKKHDAIWSAVNLIDEHGVVTGELRKPVSGDPIDRQINKMVPCLIGSAHATTKRLFLQFGPLNDDVVYEDRVLAFRSLCAGGLAYIDKKLVKYRIHSNSVSKNYKAGNFNIDKDEYLRCKVLDLNRTLSVFNNYKKDIENINKDNNSSLVIHVIEKAINKSINYVEIELLLHSCSFLLRVKGFCLNLFRFELSLKKRIQYLASLVDPRICVDYYRKKRKWGM